MKINEVEALVGITKKNIRFYESEGLLTPQRGSNGYRDYSEDDIAVLQRVKLLRKLGLPLEEIRGLQEGRTTVSDAMRRHLATLEQEQHNLAESVRLCGLLSASQETLDTLDAEDWLTRMTKLEQEGTTFMDKQKNDRKKRYIAPIICAGVMVLIMIWTLGLLLWAAAEDPIPLLALIGLLCIPAAVIIGVLVALAQRIREIDRNELDNARNY